MAMSAFTNMQTLGSSHLTSLPRLRSRQESVYEDVLYRSAYKREKLQVASTLRKMVQYVEASILRSILSPFALCLTVTLGPRSDLDCNNTAHL